LSEEETIAKESAMERDALASPQATFSPSGKRGF